MRSIGRSFASWACADSWRTASRDAADGGARKARPLTAASYFGTPRLSLVYNQAALTEKTLRRTRRKEEKRGKQ